MKYFLVLQGKARNVISMRSQVELGQIVGSSKGFIYILLNNSKGDVQDYFLDMCSDYVILQLKETSPWLY